MDLLFHILIPLMLVLIAGAGDELQGIKRGIMELCDAILVNKQDFVQWIEELVRFEGMDPGE